MDIFRHLIIRLGTEFAKSLNNRLNEQKVTEREKVVRSLQPEVVFPEKSYRFNLRKKDKKFIEIENRHVPVIEMTSSEATAKGFTYTQINSGNNVMILDYHGKMLELIVPSKIGNIPVTDIKSSAFNSAGNLKYLQLPLTVENAGNDLFFGNNIISCVAENKKLFSQFTDYFNSLEFNSKTFTERQDGLIRDEQTYVSDSEENPEKQQNSGVSEIKQQKCQFNFPRSLQLEYRKIKEYGVSSKRAVEMGISFRKKSKSVRITNYHGSADCLEIPCRIDGIKVNEISENAFKPAVNLKSVYIPQSVEKISDFIKNSNIAECTVANPLTYFYLSRICRQNERQQNLR